MSSVGLHILRHLPDAPPTAYRKLDVPPQPLQKRPALLVRGQIGLAKVHPATAADAHALQRVAQHGLGNDVAADEFQVEGRRRGGADDQCLINIEPAFQEANPVLHVGEGSQQHLVQEPLDDGRHVGPPDGKDEDQALAVLERLLVLQHQRIQRLALAEQGQLLFRVDGVEAIGIQVDEPVFLPLGVQQRLHPLQNGMVEAFLVWVGVDDGRLAHGGLPGDRAACGPLACPTQAP